MLLSTWVLMGAFPFSTNERFATAVAFIAIVQTQQTNSQHI